MKETDKPIGLRWLKKDGISDFKNRFFLNPPLSDFEILKFQNLLITPSVHYVVTKNIRTGRALMNQFLLAFKHYHNVGCLTLDESQELLSHVFNLSKLQQSNTSLIDSIELFCIENPYLNFAWIELNQALKMQISENGIKKITEMLSSDAQTPVVIMSYEDEISES